MGTAASMLHTRYSVDSSRPWFGQGPLHWAHRTGTLAGALETRLGEEAGGPVGHIIPVPSDGGDGGDDDPLAGFKADLAGARGRSILTETTSAGWGEGKRPRRNQTTDPSVSERPSRIRPCRCARTPAWPF